MHIDPYIVLGSAVVGLLVGMTGAGGGALMTPMLILLFGVTPAAAISSDLVAAVVMRPFGYIRPVIAFVIFASGLKYVGLATTALGWTLVVVLLASATFILAQLRGTKTQPETDHP